MARLHHWLTAAVLAVGMAVPAAAQQDGSAPTIAFSDPSRPGRLRIELLHGTVTITGAERQDVAIEVRRGGENRPSNRPDPPGLKRLTQNPPFSVISEDDNEVRIQSASITRPIELAIQVPLRTSLKLSVVNGDGIVVQGVEGDIEIESVNGPVSLVDVAGSVVANSVNAPVRATIARVATQKAMAFTSFNGTVDVTLPRDIKASFKLRSDQGDVFTDFDIDLRPTQTPLTVESRRKGARYRLEANRAIYGTVGGGGPEIELRSFNGDVYLRRGQ